MNKVTAFQVGTIDHQTDKAIKLSGRWFPKAAIANTFDTADGLTAVVFSDWFVTKNLWLVKDNIGIRITKGVKLSNGDTLMQGDERKYRPETVGKVISYSEMDAEFEMMLANGMGEMEASNILRTKYREHRKV